MAKFAMRQKDTAKLAERFRRLAQQAPRDVQLGLQDAADAMLPDFDATVETWEHQPEFTITGDSKSVSISTSDPIWNMLNRGTRPHGIDGFLSFLNRYSAKTRPGFIGSNSGGASGDLVFTTHVDHPGTAARWWDQAISVKWRNRIAKYVRYRLRATLGER